jgi:hypothetical protein
MEQLDVFTIFISGAALGLIGAHYLNKHERSMEYERGKLDAIWAIQCEIMRSELASRLKPTGDKAAGGEASGSTPV